MSFAIQAIRLARLLILSGMAILPTEYVINNVSILQILVLFSVQIHVFVCGIPADSLRIAQHRFIYSVVHLCR